jgi:uncharacterized protein YbjT (DUF2867 family)
LKIILFGATGMVGQGVLRECLWDPRVEQVLAVGRTTTGQAHPKLRELVHNDLRHYELIESQLNGFDACFFCLGATAAGKSEETYAHVNYDLPVAAAETLARLNPQMTFMYVSGAGTDSTEKGRLMWARVKGRTENALQRLPFKAVYLFRPGIIQPLHGIRSKTRLYQIFYDLSQPVMPLLRKLFPNQILTTEEIGRAMLRAAQQGAPQPVLEIRDIRQLAG